MKTIFYSQSRIGVYLAIHRRNNISGKNFFLPKPYRLVELETAQFSIMKRFGTNWASQGNEHQQKFVKNLTDVKMSVE
jgi:hypothetical protein